MYGHKENARPAAASITSETLQKLMQIWKIDLRFSLANMWIFMKLRKTIRNSWIQALMFIWDQ